MTLQTILILIFIGMAAGVLSGFVGVGGGIVIVPALVYMLSMSQHEAQGTSLFILLLPIGFLAVYNYYKAGSINFGYGTVIAIAFVLGGYFGSKLALRMNPNMVKLIFGILMIIISFKLVYSGIVAVSNDK
jgi:uncharacterized membrane protein YfcA